MRNTSPEFIPAISIFVIVFGFIAYLLFADAMLVTAGCLVGVCLGLAVAHEPDAEPRREHARSSTSPTWR